VVVRITGAGGIEKMGLPLGHYKKVYLRGSNNESYQKSSSVLAISGAMPITLFAGSLQRLHR
jgi:hypothetical protein